MMDIRVFASESHICKDLHQAPSEKLGHISDCERGQLISACTRDDQTMHIMH